METLIWIFWEICFADCVHEAWWQFLYIVLANNGVNICCIPPEEHVSFVGLRYLIQSSLIVARTRSSTGIALQTHEKNLTVRSLFLSVHSGGGSFLGSRSSAHAGTDILVLSSDRAREHGSISFTDSSGRGEYPTREILCMKEV